MPGPCARAFQHSTRVVGLDACHIKARYGGVLLVMSVLDGNGNVFPCALGVAESENMATWTWFVNLVRAGLHIEDGGEGIVVLGDREKGLERAVNELLPRACHGYCVCHINKNLKAHHGTVLQGILFKAAKDATEDAFNATIQAMRKANAAGAAYIEAIDKRRWARAFFARRRFGHVTSNFAESMNHWLDDARALDPVGLFSTYIRKLNPLFEKRRNEYAQLPPDALSKNVDTLFSRSDEEGRTVVAVRHSPTSFEVRRMHDPLSWRVVDLGKMTCSCGFTKNTEFPVVTCVPRSARKRKTPKASSFPSEDWRRSG